MRILLLATLAGGVSGLPAFAWDDNFVRKDIWRPLTRWVKRQVSMPISLAPTVPQPTDRQPQNITDPLTTSSNASSGVSPGAIGNALPIVDDPVDCHNLSTGMSNKCWSELNLTDYVNEWSWKPNCSKYSNSDFFGCFLQSTKFGAMNCSVIGSGNCPVPPWKLNKPYDPRQLYVVYNIYSINNFFSNWYDSIDAAQGLVTQNIATIVGILDPDKKLNMDLQILFIVFQSLFSLIPGFFGIAWSGSRMGWQVASQAVSNAMAVAPIVGRALFPTGNEASRVVQMADLGADFAKLIIKLKANLVNAFDLVRTNSSNFLAFAQQGVFCLNNNTNPASDSEYLMYAFNTYLISQALKGNNIYTVVARDTNPQQLATNGSHLAYNIDCQTLDGNNVCDAWWYSKNYRSAFTLNNFNVMSRNYHKELTQLFDARLTTGQLLFEDALACQIQGNNGKPINLTIYAGGLNAACLSQLPVLTWDTSCHPPRSDASTNSRQRRHLQPRDLATGSHCEFLEQPRQEGFLESGFVTKSNTRHKAFVPAGYLGPLIHGPYEITRSENTLR